MFVCAKYITYVFFCYLNLQKKKSPQRPTLDLNKNELDSWANSIEPIFEHFKNRPQEKVDPQNKS